MLPAPLRQVTRHGDRALGHQTKTRANRAASNARGLLLHGDARRARVARRILGGGRDRMRAGRDFLRVPLVGDRAEVRRGHHRPVDGDRQARHTDVVRRLGCDRHHAAHRRTVGRAGDHHDRRRRIGDRRDAFRERRTCRRGDLGIAGVRRDDAA